MKTSTTPLQVRFKDWLYWEDAVYQVGATLGFWKEFGAPNGEDPWNGVKKNINWVPISNSIDLFLQNLVKIGVLEIKLKEDDTVYRWNLNYKVTENE